MAKTAIISVDGHVKASRQGYRDYIQRKYLDAYDESVKAADDATGMVGLTHDRQVFPHHAGRIRSTHDVSGSECLAASALFERSQH